MKKIFLLVALMFFFINVNAQKYTEKMPINDKGVVEYSEVVEIENTAKKEIAKRVKKWIIDNYKNPKEVVLLETEDETKGKGSFPVLISNAIASTEILGSYNLTIEFKDNKFRYAFNEIFFNLDGGMQFPTERIEEFANRRRKKGKDPLKEHQQYITQTNENFKKLSDSLKEAVKNPKKSDW